MKRPASARVVTVRAADGFKDSYRALVGTSEGVATNMILFNVEKRKIPPGRLPNRMKDHVLKGQLAGIRECHLSDDVLLLYTHEGDIVKLLRCCRHDDLYGGKIAALNKTLKGIT
ncbi:MAG TPA: type II toxin-antitoxin system mRNA interferase toxin, RelE/StbE family [Dongiaceae bacterium]|jgi:addiction module RelE/StbE family toxin|nr:type II toxin-antitoxin system mRNA interferase toxin, RelE/StbE family [Dongiaceae bacterium]